ncbi:MAG TPA: undecaprenyldiphospho-muramoylpentapeptide beta-N-acetylglucosaminyltransferase [bacterium]|nr:undecaprenyldiphospho-muramoylpentapeptide beta-N-acetylglucosaminyltransferase [bacterium]
MRIIFTGGGTGGHIYPALAVAEEILNKKPQSKILFIGGTRNIESEIIGKAGFVMKTIKVTGLPRKITPQIFTFIWNLGLSIINSMRIIRGFKPSLIMGTGGYVSGPPIIAAWTMGIPIVLQEQNSYPGITTKKLARFARIVFLGFQDATGYFGKNAKTLVTGNPVRKNIQTVTRDKASTAFGLDPGLKTVLVFGGSQGAHSINCVLSEIVEDIAELDIQVIWQTGNNEYDEWKRFDGCSGGKIKVVPYIDTMSNAYAASDLVVCRAGAMTMAEITACGLPGIFIPLPNAAENHQEYNARSLVNSGAASIILERELTPGNLRREIIGIVTSDEKLKEMSEQSEKLGIRDAASVIAGIIIEQYGMN